jgi:hypothetical protein
MEKKLNFEEIDQLFEIKSKDNSSKTKSAKRDAGKNIFIQGSQPIEIFVDCDASML